MSSSSKKSMKAKDRVLNVLNQAKDSLKFLGALEKEALTRARTLVGIPKKSERKRMTNERILSSLKKVGVATQAEMDSLHKKIEKLEAALEAKQKHSSHGH